MFTSRLTSPKSTFQELTQLTHQIFIYDAIATLHTLMSFPVPKEKVHYQPKSLFNGKMIEISDVGRIT